MTQGLLRKWSEATPEAPFAVFENGASWTYAEALLKSWEIGRGLMALGVRSGDAVLSFLPNGEEAIGLFTGANAIGAVFAPLNTAYRDSFLEHAINVPRASVIVAHSSLVDRLSNLRLPYLRTVIVVGQASCSRKAVCCAPSWPCATIRPTHVPSTAGCPWTFLAPTESWR